MDFLWCYLWNESFEFKKKLLYLLRFVRLYFFENGGKYGVEATLSAI